jgi:hypothetical protein
MVLIVFVKYYVKIAIKTYLRTEQIKLKDILFIKKIFIQFFWQPCNFDYFTDFVKSYLFFDSFWYFAMSSLLQFWFFGYSSVSP